MRLELVLNEDEKKERFKVNLAKKKDTQETSNRAFEEENLNDNTDARDMESIYSNSPSSLIKTSPPSIELLMNRSFSIAQATPFQRPFSSYKHQPTGRVAPIRKIPTPTTSPCSPGLMTSSSTSALGQTPISNLRLNTILMNSEYLPNLASRPAIHTTYMRPSTTQTILPQNTSSAYYSVPSIPPLEPIHTFPNLLPRSIFDYCSNKQPDFYPPNTALDLSSPSNPTSMHQRKSVIVSRHSGVLTPKESVSPVRNSSDSEHRQKTCEAVNQGSAGFIKVKEEKIQENDDEMLFTYVHKMFRTKERNWIGNMNTADIEIDPLEASPLNR